MAIKPDTQIIPSGLLKKLKTSEVKTSITNPRILFDPGPLNDLKDSIKQHGVLVPITVYQMKGQEKYAILDGERRYRCCLEIEKESTDPNYLIEIPANIVEPPTKIAGLLYMFSIHNFRERWELMPTALSMKSVMDDLKETDNKKLAKLTGLSETQVERCKWLLEYPKEFQELSMDPNPKTRIPSNFWIEAYPVIKLYEEELPDFIFELGKNRLISILVDKYRDKKIKSVIHFRRIREAYITAKDESKEKESEILEVLKEYINNKSLETRTAFDRFLKPSEIKNAIAACDDFIKKLENQRLEFATENRGELINSLKDVTNYIDILIQKLESDELTSDKNSEDENSSN
jgi:ParB/RepB/Spo0J family partition protein